MPYDIFLYIQIDNCTKSKKETVSKKLRRGLLSSPNIGEKCFIVYLPSVEEHNEHVVGQV